MFIHLADSVLVPQGTLEGDKGVQGLHQFVSQSYGRQKHKKDLNAKLKR
jgi:hypothetical protein